MHEQRNARWAFLGAILVFVLSLGASAFLIGESFMRKPDVEKAVRELMAA